MDDSAHRDRTHALGSALERMANSRGQRGSVGVVDPFDVTSHEPQYAVTGPARAQQRRGLFSFSTRARGAASPLVFDEDLLDDE